MFIEIDDIKTHYIDEGNGEVILLIHGWGCNVEVYRNIINFLSSKFRVIALDLPGFGKTSEPPFPFGVEDYRDFTVKFAKILNLHSFILMGHSLGGRIIIKMFSKGCPFDVKSVILMGSAGIKPIQTFKAKCRTKIYKVGKTILSLNFIENHFPNLLEKYRQKHGSADYLAASPIMRQSLVKIVNEDLKGYLPSVTPPTLLIWGENDDSTPISDGRTMEGIMPNAGLAVIKNAGHYAFLDEFHIFSKILASFLNI